MSGCEFEIAESFLPPMSQVRDMGHPDYLSGQVEVVEGGLGALEVG